MMEGDHKNTHYYQTSAFLFVGGHTELSVDEISRRLEMKPNKSSKTPLKRGAKRPPGWKTWFFSTENTRELSFRSVDEVIIELISELNCKGDNFRSLPKECRREIVVSVYSEYCNNTSTVSTDAIKALSEFSFSLRIATYSGSE